MSIPPGARKQNVQAPWKPRGSPTSKPPGYSIGLLLSKLFIEPTSNIIVMNRSRQESYARGTVSLVKVAERGL